MVQIIRTIPSPLKNRKLRAIFDDDTYIDFGYSGRTYLDRHDKEKRRKHWDEMIINTTNRELMHWLIPSNITLTMFLLWNKETLTDSIDDLNKLWREHTIKY